VLAETTIGSVVGRLVQVQTVLLAALAALRNFHHASFCSLHLLGFTCLVNKTLGSRCVDNIIGSVGTQSWGSEELRVFRFPRQHRELKEPCQRRQRTERIIDWRASCPDPPPLPFSAIAHHATDGNVCRSPCRVRFCDAGYLQELLVGIGTVCAGVMNLFGKPRRR
jgi:hypothetical protein